MPRLRERRWPGLVAGYSSLLLVLAGATTPIYVSVADIDKPLVARLAVAVLTGVILVHIRSRLRRHLDNAPPSEFEQALRAVPSPPKVDPLLLRLREELQFSVSSRQYFQRVLWPRLVGLAERNGKTTLLRKPGADWVRRRGPSLQTLAALVKCLEGKP